MPSNFLKATLCRKISSFIKEIKSSLTIIFVAFLTFVLNIVPGITIFLFPLNPIELLGKVKANKVWEKVFGEASVISLSDYREEIEKKAEGTRAKVMTSLQLASTAEVAALQKQVKSLNRKVNDMNRKLKALSA